MKTHNKIFFWCYNVITAFVNIFKPVNLTKNQDHQVELFSIQPHLLFLCFPPSSVMHIKILNTVYVYILSQICAFQK